jgi:hypothetical protein
MTTSFLARYKSETAAACIDREEQQEYGYGWFKLPNYHGGAVVYDVVVPNEGKYFHNGIAIDVIIEADSIEEASNVARGAANHVFSLITLCTNTETARPEERLLLEYGSGMETRHLRQFSPPSDEEPTIGTVRKLDEDVFFPLYETIHSDEFADSDREEIIRCLDRYSSALRQQTATDQFLWFFIAFDSLENQLVKRFDVSTTKEHPCDHCGEMNTIPDNNAGKEYFLDECADTDLTYSDINGIRNSLVHGGPIGGAGEQVEEFARIVRKAIVEVLELKSKVGETLIEQDINGHLRKELMIFTASLSGYEPLELEDFLDQPGANLTREHVGYDIVGKQIRRKPTDKVGWDLPEPLAVEWYSLGYRPIGNNGVPEINDVSVDMEES